MASNQYVNKVIFGGDVIMDISSDTVAANKLLYGITAHDKSGAPITGDKQIPVSEYQMLMPLQMKSQLVNMLM